MTNRLLICFTTISVAVLTACGTYTRVERDVYTKTKMDTVVLDRIQNQPGERDQGIVYPSTRIVTMERQMNQHDSIVERFYPNFIRLALFEGVGTIGSGIGNAPSTNTGLFGVFYDLDELFFNSPLDSNASSIFSGYIYRFGVTEWRAPWFNDPDWTVGVTAYEVLCPDGDSRHSLTGAGVFNITKRIYLSERIPYLAIRPSLSLSFFPSQYVNASASADIGSIGGLNLRAYLGYAFGGDLFASTVVTNSFPYFGLGASVLDFLNREEELTTEWKYHEHSAWEIGLAEVTLVVSDAERSGFAPSQAGSKVPAIKGAVGRVAFATLALPVLDYRLSLGTSLISAVFMGAFEYGVGVFPLRLSYHWNPFQNAFAVEPFAEFAFAPSSFSHIGLRAAVPFNDQTSIHVQFGWANGSTGSSFNNLADKGLSLDGRSIVDNGFSGIYFGVGASFLERLFGRSDLRYGKGYRHE